MSLCEAGDVWVTPRLVKTDNPVCITYLVNIDIVSADTPTLT